jgi:hypothetical protein
MVNTLGDDNTLAGLARQRIKGKPFTVTEYNHPQPNYYGSEAPLLLAAYGALQDWDGIWMFDYGHGQDGTVTMGYARGFFDTAQHSGKMANLLLAANLFRRGDVRPATQEITMALTPDREIDLLANTWAWGIFSSSQLGVSGKLAFTNRLSTRVGTNAVGLTNPPPVLAGNVLTSDTGELKWDLTSAGRGVVTINTPRTKAVLGYVTNRLWQLGEVTLAPATNQLGWCTLGATLTRGNSFTNDCNVLVVASGWWENTGQVWKNANKDSVGHQWGGAPILMEVVPFTLTLPLGTNRVSAWALDERGQRKATVPITGNSSSATITIGTSAGSIWYEFEVSQQLAGFELWRSTNFTVGELADISISGESAAPAGDGVPNLLKYYLGLPAKLVAPPDRLPSGTLWPINDLRFLAMVYERDKAAADVDCTSEVSADLAAWFSGAAYTAVADLSDLGDRERVTVRDLTPVNAGATRFMRLRLTRLLP